ncbi:hypothetical protein Dda_3730 [Drechslerella dactyloides]|uniref:RNA helicase n=1 Tax=Drechslerella dactyloides TaxID=74499 RepID=A0AAD6IYH1_DREDA|nr:hypothetical protein Dda_3730 [Drechslerella dactyloides]
MSQKHNKRPRLQGPRRVPPTVPPASISTLSRIRQQHNALQASLSETGQGFKTRFMSDSPEPFAGTHLTRSQYAKRIPESDSDDEPVITNGGISELEAIRMRKKNEKARKKRERKRKRQKETERQREDDDGGYSSWNGISDGPHTDQEESPPLRPAPKKFVEEEIIIYDESAPHNIPTNGITQVAAGRAPSSSPEPANVSYIPPNKRKRKEKKRNPESGTTTSTEHLSPKHRRDPPEEISVEDILPESLAGSPATTKSPAAPPKIESVWDRMKIAAGQTQKDAESVASSRLSIGSLSDRPLPNSDTSNLTISSEEKPSPNPKAEPTATDDNPFKSSAQQKVYKNVPLKTKSRAQLEVGNDSTAGLLDPLTPNPPKSQAKTREQLSLELQAVRKALPIWSFQDEIRCRVSDSDTLVLVGETGSGKSTQIGQFLLNEKWMKRKAASTGKKYGGCIAITQPRRIAAISLAQRVSNEMGTYLGKEVGYCVRFDNKSEDCTQIRYLTDGMLLNEILHDPELSRYSAVVVDEAHERSVQTDLGLGLLKGIVDARKKKNVNMKLIVMSATLDVDRMAGYIGASPTADESTSSNVPAPICRIPGKLYPVETFYTPTTLEDFQTAALKTIFQVHYQHPCPGDILVFSTGSEEIEELASTVQELSLQIDADKPKMQVLKLYASLDPAEQQKVFTKGDPKVRRVIIATNIAETSVTVPGVRHVIDCGKVKVKRFRHQLGIESLLIADISQASAQQRRGRAGREGPGTCYRLYTETSYQKFDKNTEPEIVHCDLQSALLTLKARGISDVFNFPFLDRPNRYSFEKALLGLNLLDALDDEGRLTDVGIKMSKFPLPPVQSRVIIAASEAEAESINMDEDVLVDVIDVLSCLSVDGNIMLQPTRWSKGVDKAKKVDPLLPNIKKKRKKPTEDDDDEDDEYITVEEKVHTKRMEIVHPSGDHITYLNILRRYLSKRSSEQRRFCEEYQLSYPLMRKVENIRKQLRGYCRLDKVGDLPRESELKYESETMVARYPRVSEEQTEKILRCFLKGLGVESVAKRVAGGKYRALAASGSAGMDVAVHPSSSLTWERHSGGENKRARKEGGGEPERRDEGYGEALMYQDVVWTSKAFMKVVSRIKISWLREMWVVAT